MKNAHFCVKHIEEKNPVNRAHMFCLSFTGMSESEQTLKGTSQIKILSPEEIEGMRVVCKVLESLLDLLVLHCCCMGHAWGNECMNVYFTKDLM